MEWLKNVCLEARKVIQRSSTSSWAGTAQLRLEPQIRLTTRRGGGAGRRARTLPQEAWISAAAVDVVTEVVRCLGTSETPLGLHRCGEFPCWASVTMSVLDALWEDRDVRFDVSSQ